MLFIRAVFPALALFSLSCSPTIPNLDSLTQELGALPPFSLTNQDEKKIGREDLKGKVWVAHFFFSCCTQGCPQTTANMQKLQQFFAGKKDVALVSISVWPENDTPQILQKYAQDWKADPEQWFFLTGPEKEIYHLVEKGFFQSVEKHPDKEPGQKVSHTFRLMLVDRQGRIQGYVDGKDSHQVEMLIHQIRQLASGKYVLPFLNACLNTLCTILLILGLAAVKRGWLQLHKVIMLAALLSSVIFLVSYLYFHFAVLDGQPTRFRGEGIVRVVYFGILFSHTILAAAVAPMALITVFFGLTNRLPKHRTLARWTWPLWLYVSITGVVVYVILYQWYPPF